ncbi:hypothetical protein H0H93_005184 [Arthromyces matolae]|nr:hypothetical protein H0H93_005184 [Arthromyces matolae]
MASDPTPPPPGDDSVDSWQKYEAKAVEKDKEVDREVIDKMLEFQKQFVLKILEASPSDSSSHPTFPPSSSSLADPPLSTVPNVVVDPSPPPTVPTLLVTPSVPDSSDAVVNPLPSSVPPSDPEAIGPPQVSDSVVPKRSTGPRRMSSKPDVTAEDRKRINLEMEKTGPSRAQLLAAVQKLENPSEEWWKEHSPCEKCGPSGDCIPYRWKNLPIKSCVFCHGKRVECSIKVTWYMFELARLHPDWPLWWIQERIHEGWLKKPRGAKLEGGSKPGPSKAASSKVDGKGKRKAEVVESDSESSSQDTDSDSEVPVSRPTKRLRKVVRVASSPEYRPYSQPPGPIPLPGRPLAKPLPSKPPKVSPPATSSSPSKPQVPLFAPSATPEVMIVSPPPPPKPLPLLVPDPKSPLNIRIPPRPPRLPSPPVSSSLRGPPPVSPELETRNQVFEGTQFSRGDVLRGRLADARRQSLVFGQGLEQFTTHASAWSLQLESFRREFQERGFEPSSRGARFFDHVVEESRRLALHWGDVLNAGDCEHMRSVTSGIHMPSQQELIDEMDKEGMDVRWEQQLEKCFKSLKTKFLSFEERSFVVNDDTNFSSSKKILSVELISNGLDELTVSVIKEASTGDNHVSPAGDVVLIDNINVDPSLVSSPLSTTSLPCNAAAQMTPVVSLSHPATVISSIDDALTVVPKPASVFVSRLNPKTTVQQVEDYIKKKIGDGNIIKVKKLTNNLRPVSSFRIDVASNMMNKILQKEIWPEGTFINVFENRTSSRVKTILLMLEG